MDVILHFFQSMADLAQVLYIFFIDFFHGMQYVISSLGVLVAQVPEYVRAFPTGVSVLMLSIVYTVVALRIIGRS